MTPPERDKAITDAITLATSGNVQDDVLQWIIDLDTFYVCPKNAVQRYAAAVVSKKLFGTDPLSTSHECSWAGFDCNTEYQVLEVKYGEYL